MMRASINIQEPGRSEFLAKTLKPETVRSIPRTSVDVDVEDGELVIRVMAEDVNALRAALNSYIRWIKLALDTEKTVGGI